MPKKQEAVRTAVQPHGSENRDQTVSHGSLWIWTFKKKKKNTEKQNKKKHNCWEEQADLTLLHSQNTSQIIQTQKKNPILTINLNQKKKKKMKKNKPIWPNLVVGWRTNGGEAADAEDDTSHVEN